MEGLRSEPFHIPNGSPDVEMATLRVEDSRARTVVVRFPAGWHRPGPGYYEASEELVMLEGVLEMSGETYVPGDWAYVPAGYTRTETRTMDGALVYARFGGAARWQQEPGSSHGLMRTSLGALRQRQPSPLGSGRAWLLRADAEDSAWVVEGFEVGAPAPVEAELFDLEARAWAFVAAGEPLPAFGRTFCRAMVGSRT